MPDYSAAIVDFDGTLFDTRRAISATLRETFAAYNVPPPSCERIDALIGRGINLEETFIHLMPQDVAIGQLNEWIINYRRFYDSGAGLCASTPFPAVEWL
jgi:phosphoglycolate phosphatase